MPESLKHSYILESGQRNNPAKKFWYTYCKSLRDIQEGHPDPYSIDQ